MQPELRPGPLRRDRPRRRVGARFPDYLMPISMTDSPGRRPAGVRRIVVLRAGGLGDFMFALPALEALRAAFPEAEITVVGEAWQEELLAGRDGPVDRFVALSL